MRFGHVWLGVAGEASCGYVRFVMAWCGRLWNDSAGKLRLGASRQGYAWFGMAGMASSGVVSCAVDGSGVG